MIYAACKLVATHTFLYSPELFGLHLRLWAHLCVFANDNTYNSYVLLHLQFATWQQVKWS